MTFLKNGVYKLSFLFLACSFMMTSCTKDEDPVTVTVDSSQPDGAFTVSRTGSLTAQSMTPTAGTVELGTDESNTNFVHFAENFVTELGTGTVSLYFSTSDTFTADPGNGNPDLLLVGAVQKNGERYLKLDAAVPANFTHIILWCNTAGVPFGNARLQ